jgi:Protein of unknown function, DUF393.
MNELPKILLVYDKECPACHRYCTMVRIRESAGELVLVDAREPSEIKDEITKLGWDIDQGMVLKIDSQLYYGSDAMHMLSLLSTSSGIFNRLNYLLFRRKRFACVLYPVLRTCRNLLLKILRKSKINNLQSPGNDSF